MAVSLEQIHAVADELEAAGLIHEYLEAAGHGTEDSGALFRSLHHSRGAESQKL